MRNVILVLVLEFLLCVSGIKLKGLILRSQDLPESPRKQKISKAQQKLRALADNVEKAEALSQYETSEMNELLQEIQALSEWREGKKVQSSGIRTGLKLGSLITTVGSVACSLTGCRKAAKGLLNVSEAMSGVEHGIGQKMQKSKEELIKMRKELKRLQQNVDDADKNCDEARRIYSGAISEIDILIKEREYQRLLEKFLIFPNLKRIFKLNEEARKASHGPGSASDASSTVDSDRLSTWSEGSNEESSREAEKVSESDD